MVRRKKGLQSIFGLFFGILCSHLVKQYYDIPQIGECPSTIRIVRKPLKLSNPMDIIGMKDNETIENSDRTLLFVGVMTAEKYLSTRAKAVYETWGSDLPGRIAFFSSEFSYSDDIPLVALPGVDDTYPPQKKSFMMLQYMYENFGDKFEWFLRADDDVYIRMDKLESLLRSVDSRKPWFIGQAGRGNSEEFGLLSLDHDENFCMGGPGVILSKETLRRIAPHLRKCLQELYTTHEDVELGRCVRKFAGVQCTWSYEMQTILYHNQSGSAAFTGELKQREVHRAITMHPVKDPSHMYRLHSYVKGLSIQSLEQDKVNLHRDIALAMKQLNTNRSQLTNAKLGDQISLFPTAIGLPEYLGNPEILGTPPGLVRFQPTELEDVLNWELIVGRTLYPITEFNPRHKVISSLKEGLDDIIREVMAMINMYSKQRGRVIDYRELIYGYWRLDPIHGADTVVDMLLTYRKYRGHKMTVPVRRHAYLQQTFTGLYIREENYSENLEDYEKLSTQSVTSPKLFHQIKEVFHKHISNLGKNLKELPNIFDLTTESINSPRNKKISFILPLSGRYNTLVRFLKIYENICLKSYENTRLIIVLFKNNLEYEDYHKSLDLIENLQTKYLRNDIIVKQVPGVFSRGLALQKGTELCTEEDLMFFIDVDIVFNSETLLRVRLNTIKNKQVYFPIVYSQYDPKIVYSDEFNENSNEIKPENEFLINEKNGVWRQFGFGISSIYKSDFTRIGSFNTNITGWGFEDVDFYHHVIKSKTKIIRTPDPGLVHIFHPVECDNNLNKTQKEMCLGTKISMFGSYYNLQQYMKKHPDILEKARNAKQENSPG